MSIGKTLAVEIRTEAKTTRRVLERIQDDKLDWRPHEKSMTMGRLASHLAELPNWAEAVVSMDGMELDPSHKPWIAGSAKELLEQFDQYVEKAVAALSEQSDERMMQNWKLTVGGRTAFELPRIGVIRGMILNHGYHHRGQLSVYLRLNDIPVPSIYGPSADEQA